MVDQEETEQTVFETPDSPDTASVSSDPPEYVSEYIIGDELRPLSARDVFEQSSVDNSLTDFEKLKKTGWRVTRRDETRVERVARLRRELEVLRSENPDDGSPIDMLSDLQRMVDVTSQPEAVMSPGRVASQITLESIEKMSLLETRLSRLELRIGSTTSTALASQVAVMRAKIGLLTSSPATIDQKSELLKKLSEQSRNLQESDVSVKIDGLYRALDTINGLSPTVPLVLDRLRSLQKVHEDAAESRTKLQTIQTDLAARSEEIRGWKTTLERVEKQVQSSGGVMHENLEAVRKMTASLAPSLA